MNSEHHDVCSSEEWATTVRELVIPWVVGDIDLGGDVIEVGPGFGATTVVLRERVPRLTAVEIDRELAARLAGLLAGSNVDVVEGDATSLQFDDARFSGAASFAMLHHVPSPELQDRVFAELARVLRPGGVLVASDSLHSDDLRTFHRDDTYMPIDPSGLPRRLEAAGFTDVEVDQNEFAWKAFAHRD